MRLRLALPPALRRAPDVPARSRGRVGLVVRPSGDALVERDGRAHLELAGRRLDLATPFDWRRAGEDLCLLGDLHGFAWCARLDDAAFAAVALDWIRAESERRVARAAHAPHVVARRAIAWLAETDRRAARLAPEVLAALRATIAADARRLASHPARNAGPATAAALLALGAAHEGPEARAWTRRGIDLVDARLDAWFPPDGIAPADSPARHVERVADLCAARARIAREPDAASGALRARVDAALARAAQALRDLLHPDGAPSLFGEGGLHPAHDPGLVLRAAEQALGRRVEARGAFALPSIGVHGARDGASLVLVECGPMRADGRDQADALSFEWTVRGERLIVDPGCSEGFGRREAAEARATWSHNALSLDGLDACASGRAWLGGGRRARVRRTRWQPRDDGFVIEGLHDGYESLPGEPLVRRLVRATPHEIRVEDRVEGGAGQEARVTLLLHPACVARTSGEGTVLLARGRAAARVVAETPIGIEDAVWRPEPGLSVPTRRLVVHHGRAPCVAGLWLRALSA